MTTDVPEYRSNPIVRTEAGAEHFLQRHAKAERLYPCYLGHMECSPDPGGPCLDETLANFPELEDRT